MSLEALKEKWQNLSKVQKILIGSIGISLLVVAILLGQWLTKDEYVPLMTDLDTKNASAITTKLKDLNIPYQLGAEGKSILVLKDQVYDIRLQLASEGILDGGGLGFELFDQTKLGVTDFERQLNYQRALQEELRRTIIQLDEVEAARVHLVLQDKNVFLDEEKEASASIALKLKPLAQLKPEQVKGIIYLVSSSVEGLPPERVSVIDMNGNIISDEALENEESFNPSKITLTQYELQRNYEKDLEKRVQEMLEKILGPGKAVAMVSAELNFDQEESTVTTYGYGVVRSEQLIDEKSKTTGVGVPPVGTGSNNNPDTYVGANTGQTDYTKNDQTKNYEIDESKVKTIKAPGQVNRISTSVTVDGVVDPALVAKIEGMVAAAIGYSTSRGDQVSVSSMDFDTSYMDKINDDMEKAAQEEAQRLQRGALIKWGSLAVIALAITGVIGVVLWRKRRSEVGNELDLVIDEPIPIAELETVETEEIETEPIAAIENRAFDRHDEVKDIVKDKPDEVASLLKVWLTE